jgi:predicted transcriptional regulator
MSLPSTKAAPQKATIVRGLTVLLAYGHFRWEGFKMGSHEGGRFKVFLEQAIRDGKITTGLWQRRTWIGFAVLSRLVSTFLSHTVVYGTNNWDITIAKCLSVVLVAALGARSGDVARSSLYKGQEYLQYRHIALYIDKAHSGRPTLADLRATITLEFQKGHKTANNEETDKYLSPLGHQQSHMCPIAWILVHALRHSLVAGTTLQDVLDHASARSDHQVKWLYPSRPVLAAIALTPSRHVDLEKPADAKQLLNNVKEMGVVSGMLDRAYMHAIRLGSARDVAQLPQDATTGYNTDHVRQSLGHTVKSTNKGVTDVYIGGSHVETYNQRAQHSIQPKGKVPRFANGSEIESRTTTQEKLKGSLAALPDVTTPRRRPLADLDVNTSTTTAHKAVAHPLQNVDPSLLTEGDIAEVAAAVTTSAATELCDMVFQESEPEVQPGMETTTLQDVFDNPDTQSALRSLTDESGLEEDEALFVDDRIPATTYSGSEFVAAYSKINIVNNHHVGRAWHLANAEDIAKAMETCCMFGGSRDEPTPMIHKCSKTPGCTFTSYAPDYFKSHQSLCSQERMDRFATALSVVDESDAYACTYEGCGYKPAPGTDQKQQLGTHIRTTHTFVPKPCEHGCDPETLYNNYNMYRNHLMKMHDPKYPAPCVFPGCTSTSKFATVYNLKYHLQDTHKLGDFYEIDSYVPPPDPVRRYIETQQCWLEGCGQTIKGFDSMVRHLTRKKHGMTGDDARAAVKADAEYEMVVEARKPNAKKRAITTKQLEKEQGNAQKPKS